VEATPVVGRLDVLEQAGGRLLAGGVGRTVNTFVLETAEEVLGWDVVPGEIQPALVCPDVSEIGSPYPVRRRRDEATVQQILRHRQIVLRIRGCLVAELMPRPDAVAAHQPFHLCLGGRKLATSQLVHHPRAAS